MRGRHIAAAGLLCLWLAGLAGSARAEVAVPPLRARVTDLTATLSRAQQAAIEQELAGFERKKGAQIAVLLVPTTRPEPVQAFAVRVQEQWKLGREGVDDGVLLAIAKGDRELWIEVGYGLEGILPDAIAKRIIEEDILPRFREGDFYGGIVTGVRRIMNVIEGEPLPPPRQQGTATQHVKLDWLFPVFVMLMLGRRLIAAVLGRFGGAAVSGGIIGLLAWLVIGSLLAAFFAGLFMFAFSLFAGIPGGRVSRGWGGRWSTGGFARGGGGGFGGGGFSGGGGLSGGGGAGGRW